jgi:YHS domain-containing protein
MKTISFRPRGIFSHPLVRAMYLLFHFGLFTVLTIFISSCSSSAQKHDGFLVNLNEQGVIIEGYDPVAFFKEGKPVKGDAKFNLKYEGATYHFASKENLDLFKASPDQYKPQYGAYCAYAVSLGRTAPISIEKWSIQDGRLLFQHNQRAVDGWNKDAAGSLVKADKYWPSVVNNNGKQIKTDEEKQFLVNVDDDMVILDGYDAVAYFTEGKAIKGDAKFSARYQGATFWFASQEHADQFKDEPAKFAPQYGAFCGYAVSVGKLRPINPEIFQIIDGRLILQHSPTALRLWNKDIQKSVHDADQNWPGLVSKHTTGGPVKYDEPAMNPETGTTENM